MLIQRVGRTDAEKIFIICKNGEATTISTGMGARFLGGLAAEVASTDGISCIKLDAAATMCQFAGIADQDIASLGYGRVQAWGYCNSVLLSQEADKTIGVAARAQTILTKGGGAGMFTSVAGDTNLSTLSLVTIQPFLKYVQIMDTCNISGGLNYCKAFVRAL